MSTTAKRKEVSIASNGSVPNVDPKENITENVQSRRSRQLEKEDRQSLVIWKRPFTTLEYFVKEVFMLLHTYGQK